MELDQIVNLVNGSMPLPADKKKWVEACDRISFHALGIRPQFYNTRRNPVSGSKWQGLITPANYDKRYQYLIDDYILNRHPNEQWEHYQWRLSTFPLVAEEAYLNAESQILGSIYQNSQYTIEASRQTDVDYLDNIDFYNDIKYKIPRHIFTDPFGKIAVIEGHYGEFSRTEKALPQIELIESRHILYLSKDEAIFFQSSQKYDGKKVFYWIDTKYCIRFIEEQTQSKGRAVLTTYEHNIGYMPVVSNDTDFFKPFVSRADMLCRNMSDDEVITKNASYPHITIVQEACESCGGGGFIYEDCDSGKCQVECKSCNGKGTISINPGEYHIVKEAGLRAAADGSMNVPQHIRFDNPDISINQHSLERVKWLEEKLLRSMNMLRTEDSQSGVAKAYDWQPMWYMLSRISEKLFEIDELLLWYILKFLNPSGEPQYTVARPTQFKIKTEADIQAEYKELATSSADLYLRRQKQNELMQTTLTGNLLELKKWDAIRFWDVLWGMSSEEIANAKLVAGLPNEYFIRHIFVETLLQQIEGERGAAWLMDNTTIEIGNVLSEMVKPFIPASAVQPVNIEF